MFISLICGVFIYLFFFVGAQQQVRCCTENSFLVACRCIKCAVKVSKSHPHSIYYSRCISSSPFL